jgi:hypothetical protein
LSSSNHPATLTCSRVIELPLAFRDKWTMEAINVYKNTVRANAPYVPDNGTWMPKDRPTFPFLLLFLVEMFSLIDRLLSRSDLC